MRLLPIPISWVSWIKFHRIYGLVVLPKSLAAEYANRAMDVLEKENRLRAEIKAGETLGKVAELLRWEKKG